MMLLAVATAVGVGTPAFAAPHPAPNAASASHSTNATKHHADRARSTATTQAHGTSRATTAKPSAAGAGSAQASSAGSASAGSASAGKTSAAKTSAQPKASAAKTPAKAAAKAAGGTASSNPNVSGAIADLVAAPGAAAVNLSWTDFPSADHYTAVDEATDSCDWGNAASVLTGSTWTCVMPIAVTAGHRATHTATVTAYDVNNAPLATADVTFTVGPPTVPTNVTATANDDGTITVTWGPPDALGAGLDSAGGYYLEADDSAGNNPNHSVASSVHTYTFPGPFQAATDVVVSVTAVGNVDTDAGEVSGDNNSDAATDTATTPLGMPEPNTASVPDLTENADGTVTVHWSNATSPHGVVNYTVTTSPDAGTCSTDPADSQIGGDLNCDVGPVAAGVVYTFSIVANGDNDSHSAALHFGPWVFGQLGPPMDVTAQPWDGHATVSWTAPTGYPTTSIAYYTVTSSHGEVCNTFDASATTCIIGGLSDFTSYTFTVVAHRKVGATPEASADSDPSAPSAAVVPMPGTITLKAGANSKYVTAESGGGLPLIANRSAAGAWETFSTVGNSDGTISLVAVNGDYVSSNNGGAPVKADRTALGAWEKWTIVDNGDGTFSLRASNGKYLCAEAGGAQSLVANRSSVGAWEKFTITAAS